MKRAYPEYPFRRISDAFAKAQALGRAALIPYFTAGFPRLEVLPDVVRALTEAGADLIEVGIPFSDPLADGPVLQRASSQALAAGTRLRDILQVVGELSASAPPLLFLTYINPVLRYGQRKFMEDTAARGVCGVIIPDLPWIEAASLRRDGQRAGISVIPLVAPTSTEQHLKAIQQATGFVYGVSVTGVTGLRQAVDPGVGALVTRVRQVVTLPVAIGFGISSPEHARQVGAVADGVIVGSALIQQMLDHPGREAQAAKEFVGGLRRALEAR